MAKITKNFCDRCGKEIKYIGWTALAARPKRIFVRKLLNGNHSGHQYADWNFELCNACTKALDSFIDKNTPLVGEGKDND